MTESHVSIVEFENVMESYHEAKSKEEAIEFAKFFITWRNKSHNKNRMTSYQMAYRQFLAAFGKEQEGWASKAHIQIVIREKKKRTNLIHVNVRVEI